MRSLRVSISQWKKVGSPQLVVSILETAYYGEMLCLLSLYLRCLTTAMEREVLQIDWCTL